MTPRYRAQEAFAKIFLSNEQEHLSRPMTLALDYG
jgi:hypothetical protein